MKLEHSFKKFDRESIVKGQIKKINSGYAPLLVTDFFQTLTNSRINVNDILRALLKYAKEHPENRYYIHFSVIYRCHEYRQNQPMRVVG